MEQNKVAYQKSASKVVWKYLKVLSEGVGGQDEFRDAVLVSGNIGRGTWAQIVS